MVGNIPAKLKLFVCDPIKITVNYDDCDIQIANIETMHPAFERALAL